MPELSGPEFVRYCKVVDEVHAADENRAEQHDRTAAEDTRPQSLAGGFVGWRIGDSRGHGFA